MYKYQVTFSGSSFSVVLKIPMVTMYVTIKFPLGRVVPLGSVTKKCKMTPSVYIVNGLIFQKIVPLTKFLKVAPKHLIILCSWMFKKNKSCCLYLEVHRFGSSFLEPRVFMQHHMRNITCISLDTLTAISVHSTLKILQQNFKTTNCTVSRVKNGLGFCCPHVESISLWQLKKNVKILKHNLNNIHML